MTEQAADHLVEQIRRLGVDDAAVLEAMRTVPREEFVSPSAREFAWLNTALPIEEGQTISQPLIVASMAEALELQPDAKVLEIGTGSGYAAAVMAELAGEVYTVERHATLAETARERLERLGYKNVHVLHGDGTRGWPEHAPYDAIAVAAGGPDVPQPLLDQLRIGGRLVMPVGTRDSQELVRVRRTWDEEYERETLADVRFVPLIGEEGWSEENGKASPPRTRSPGGRSADAVSLIREAAETIGDIDGHDLTPLLGRIGDACLVLIGEATHGTSEFYTMRAEITKELIRSRRIRFVAIEADWPDAARINRYVTQRQSREQQKWEAFARFPTWMWRNEEVLSFIEWLREFNLAQSDPLRRVAFYGLDLYNMYGSIRAVLEYLDRVDPRAAAVARERYGCLAPWEGDPATYGRAALSDSYRTCEQDVVSMLRDLQERQLEYARHDGEQFLDADLNARLIASAEQYYRVMYYGSVESWNLRDRHMFDVLESLLEFHGPESRAVVWEHNSHLGDAAATEMGWHGEINVGHLCRDRFGDSAYLIGQGTHQGTVAAADHWDGPVKIMQVRPSLPESCEDLCHRSGREAFLLPLRNPRRLELRERLEAQRLERAIGVLYRPNTERQSHYFHVRLPQQFDEWIWFDQTRAIRPIGRDDLRAHPAHHPFATVD